MSALKQLMCGLSLAAVLFGTSAAYAETLEIASGSDNTKMLDAIGAGFEAENPSVKIKVPPGPRSYDELQQDLLRRVTIGQSLPDLVVVGSGQRLYAERGLAVRLDPFIAANPELEIARASPVVREKGRVGKAIYGAAFGVGTPVVIFNSDLVRKAGGDPNNLPTDWDGVLALAQKIDRLGSPIIGGYFEADGTGAISLLWLLQSFGGHFMNGDETKLEINTPAGLEAMNVLKGFGEVGQAKAAMTRDQARQAFAAGTIGVLAGTSSTIAPAEKAAGNRFKVLAKPFPVKPQVGTIATVGPIASIMTKDPERQKLALKFIDFAVGPKGQQIVGENSGYYPLNQRAIGASPELKSLLAQRPNANAVLNRLDVATGWYAPPGPNGPRIYTIVTDHLLRVVGLKEAPEVAVKALTKEIEPLVNVRR
ncbi:extracellular solute-binding protein [Bradyrhizobium cenepequi]|uniref:extracellular solute-binding protein n=1 Tax=Bradyrhizobium cenepequi TaxID=2821403 RepID=UPI001CE2F242|nr:extracellular solute-binding protein [Bradyrhizobium cenepequi]MCA6112806.1 extracellular solute-binding protein [Bradyrhizobium cenepequi]